MCTCGIFIFGRSNIECSPKLYSLVIEDDSDFFWNFPPAVLFYKFNFFYTSQRLEKMLIYNHSARQPPKTLIGLFDHEYLVFVFYEAATSMVLRSKVFRYFLGVLSYQSCYFWFHNYCIILIWIPMSMANSLACWAVVYEIILNKCLFIWVAVLNFKF